MKRWLQGLLLTFITVSALAVPAKHGQWKTILLSNGTEIRACLVGDENGHFWRGVDGKAYISVDGTGYYEATDGEQLLKRAKTRLYQSNNRRKQRILRRAAEDKSGYFGEKKGLIILVNFIDASMADKHNQNYFYRMANEENFSEDNFSGSVRDYFKAQSYGQFILDFDVVGPVTVSQNYAYYGKNDSEGDDVAAGEMVIEAINLVKSQISNWKQYDWDSDGEVDQVYVVYAGQGEADGGSENTIWPHEYNLIDAKYFGDGTGPVTVGTNLVVNTYACSSELNGVKKINGIGTPCHEFSHCLGFPDYYDNDYSGGQGMAYWDLMDLGSYNGDGYVPAGYTSFERWQAGWLEPVVLEEKDSVITSMKALSESDECFIVYNKGHRDEFFLLENRQFTGWDSELPGNGLLILHVDYDEKKWAYNTPNDDPKHQHMTWMAADNTYEYAWEGMTTDPYPYNSNNKFNKSSKPAAKFFNLNTDNTYYLDSSIEEIALDKDNNTISFKFVASSSDPVVPTPVPDNAIFYESFNDCKGKGGNDGEWSGNVANSTFVPDVEGWVAEKAYGGDACAKFGIEKVTGSATTPAFTMDGKGILTFKAGAWDSTNDNKTLELSVSTGTINPSSVTMERGEFSEFSATIEATGKVTITFESSKGRFFLDEVLVSKPTSTGINTVAAQESKTQRIYTIDGRYVGNQFNQLHPGLYIMNGKKVVK